MIVSLQVRQFALFENIQLELEKGMTVFTGETGAGKSILVDALGAVFGSRANVDWVRHGAEKAEVIAEIESNDPRLIALLVEQDIDVDDAILIRRVITAEGRSKAWINGTPTSAGVLKKIGNICFDLHGQHEHQTLMQPEFQQDIIDARVKKNIKDAVSQAFQELQHIRQQLQNLHGHRNEAVQKEAWMREESERISVLNIELGLEDKLETECEAGRHIEQVQLAAANAANLLDEQEVNLRGILGEIIHQVDTVAEHHAGLQEARNLLNQMDALASEIPSYLQNVLDSSMDAEALIAVEERLAQLRAAKRRHDTDEAGLIGLLEHWQEALNTLDTAAWDEEALQSQLQTCEQSYEHAAQALHTARIKASATLVQSLRPFLDQLGLKNMQLQTSIVAQTDKQLWKVDGWDDIQLLAAANIGEPFKSLADTASGGELSRLVLALKGCGALENEPDTAIFDEVDVGIGGETGWCVGQLLRNMGSERQVFVVSHLPQVASCAHHQIAISKRVKNNRTHTTLIPLNIEARQQEVARMLGGVNTESLSHAQTMLSKGQA
ncbi:MAG: DNA repair protein RecN [Zetaproteobacteria bacterium]|nr:MAG: DNA repair protein RecN [Zetaproteobacteria bacterium]